MGVYGLSQIAFAENGQFLITQNYETVLGISQKADAMPIGEKLTPNPVSPAAQEAWTARNDKEYLLVSEKYSSSNYRETPNVQTRTDERIPGYVDNGIYPVKGTEFSAVKITREDSAEGYQSTPTMAGRDVKSLTAERKDGVEYLSIQDSTYVDAAAAIPFSRLEQTLTIQSEAVWVDIDKEMAGKTVHVKVPSEGSYFVYDAKMNCIITSLEKETRESFVLPEDGRIVFVGEPGATFDIK